MSGDSDFKSARAEYADGEDFFKRFGAAMTRADLAGKTVLDLGCGFGGRTVFYARECGASTVEGVEIDETMVSRCQGFAEAIGCENVKFRIGFAEHLPYPDGKFDAVVSFDVLEHVEDPVRSLGEIGRVLQPGGVAWLVLPSYLGAASAHLDYLTRIPALHRVFDPDVIIDVVNEFLSADFERYHVFQQPPPRETPVGRITLPWLNGITYREARAAVADTGLVVQHELVHPLAEATGSLRAARMVAKPMALFKRDGDYPELLIKGVAWSLRKPHGERPQNEYRATSALV
jgi:ubiquinone/menaquinone biosynthesis C-methylase UbiE